MKRLYSMLLATAFLVASIIPSYGASVAVTATGGATPTSLLSTGGLVNEVVIANSTASVMAFKLFDSPVAGVTYTNVGYTVRSSSVVSITNAIVTITGVTNTTIYPALQTTEVTYTGGTNINYGTVVAITVPASGTVSWVPIAGYRATLGLTCTNDQTGIITIDYSPN